MTKKKETLFISGAGSKEQDKYAQLVAKGLPLRQAFQQAGYKGTNADRPKKLAREIKHVINFYRKQLAQYVDITDKQMLYEQSCIAKSSVKDLIDFDTGEFLPLEELPPNVAKAIKKMNITETADGRKKYFYEFWDKQRALADLAAYKAVVQEKNNGGKKLVIDVKKEKKND